MINLAKGAVGASDAALLGALFTIQLFSAALLRHRMQPNARKRVRLYMDEFQVYAGETLVQMMAECRKFGLELVLANQSLSQIDGRDGGPDVSSSILANVGSIIGFRCGADDARKLGDWLCVDIAPSELTRLPDRAFVARLMSSGVPLPPTVGRTVDVQ